MLRRLKTSYPKNYFNLSDCPSYDTHEFVMALGDKKTGLKAFIAIHNTNLGPALGGTRMKSYDSEDEALKDVLNLSRAMSYKCALANLPYGGGKAVVITNGITDRTAVLEAYATLVDRLRGLFRTGTDVGVSDSDVAHMFRYTGYMLGVKEADRGDLNTSKAAALGVFYAIRATLQELDGTPDLNGKSVAIKGAGKLGGELARLLIEAGGKVIISDIQEGQTQQLKEHLPVVEVVSNSTIHKQQVDIYAPCALGNEFNVDTIPELRCRAIVGGANNQLADAAAGEALYKKQILYAPDYIANGGGLIYVADELEEGGFSARRVRRRVAAIEQTLGEIFTEATHQRIAPFQAADHVAMARMEKGSYAH